MTIFLILWIIAGVSIGWIGNDLVFGIFKITTPILFNYICGFVGGLIIYTILL